MTLGGGVGVATDQIPIRVPCIPEKLGTDVILSQLPVERSRSCTRLAIGDLTASSSRRGAFILHLRSTIYGLLLALGPCTQELRVDGRFDATNAKPDSTEAPQRPDVKRSTPDACSANEGRQIQGREVE